MRHLVQALGPLAPGDRVALLSASGPPSGRQLDRAEELIRDWGLVPVRYPSATARHPLHDYLAGSDAQRARDVEDAWCDPSINAVFCVRGGYGSVRVLDLLDADRMRAATPKPLFGSSDVTALHEWLREQIGVCTWHTPMIATGDLLDDPVAIVNLRQAVFEPWEGRRYVRPGAEVWVPGTAAGRLIGGNLSLLAMTTGARGRPALDNSGCLALIEDVTEDTYKFDGYFQTLLRSGWFDGLAGIVLGSWRDCRPDEVRALAGELLIPLGVPLVWEFGFGHDRESMCLPLGVNALLSAEEPEPSLTLEGGVQG
ncbi:S66 peptidase family protein [Nigerium massiliense]|uniref:S66 peptidase family protein n=1 Tax=Nigerium massiliense TaxID=1522317 RepID=UPI00058C98DA|nr:LD-carboxypeptidase [Nigerium massiliense]